MVGTVPTAYQAVPDVEPIGWACMACCGLRRLEHMQPRCTNALLHLTIGQSDAAWSALTGHEKA